MPPPPIKPGCDKLLGTDGTTDETWLTILDGTLETGGNTGSLSTWFCCAPAATAYPDTGGGGALDGRVFCVDSSPLLDS